MDIQYIQIMANGYNANPVDQGGQPQEENHNLPIKLVKTDKLYILLYLLKW